MASLPSTLALSSTSSLPPHRHLPFSSSSFSSSSAFLCTSPALRLRSLRPSSWTPSRGLAVCAMTLDFSDSLFDGGKDEDGGAPPGPTAEEDKEELQCPPGLRQYETMAVLRPDMSEEERLAFTQKYEERTAGTSRFYQEVPIMFCHRPSMHYLIARGKSREFSFSVSEDCCLPAS